MIRRDALRRFVGGPLKLIHPERKTLKRVPEINVEFSLSGRVLDVHFTVKGQKPYVNPQLGLSGSQWGLWDWDVVEVFIQTSSAPTYYEFEVSPLNQFLELEIFEPRKRMNKDFASGFGHTATLQLPDNWEASLSLPLDKMGWDGRPESLRGNAFAVLGDHPRSYFSLFLPAQERPDFHLPQYFRPLLP